MINLHFDNIWSTLNKKEFKADKDVIHSLLQKIQQREQGFTTVIDNEHTILNIQNFVDNIDGKYTDIVLCGIGGSALGSIALRDAFVLPYEKTSYPKLHVLENIDPDILQNFVEYCDLSKTLFIIITKSGGTTETLSEYFYFRHLVDQANLSPQEHFVFITDEKKGLLRKIATEENIPSFPIPASVGGRFSITTNASLLPAALIGVDIQSLVAGMQTMRDSFLLEDLSQNLPYQLAILQFLCYQKGYTQNVLMPYSTKLRTFALWWAQLLAESTGKINHKKKNVGLTPLPALGVTDQHSQLQLYAEGPDDKLVMFIQVKNFSKTVPIIVPEKYLKSIPFLQEASFAKLLKAEYEGTAQSLLELERPNLTISIDEVCAESFGELSMLFMGSTAFLGELLEINTFNQPGVERSKIITKENLLSLI